MYIAGLFLIPCGPERTIMSAEVYSLSPIESPPINSLFYYGDFIFKSLFHASENGSFDAYFGVRETHKYLENTMILGNMKKEAILWNKLAENKVECVACARRCRIPAGSRGFCYVRQNTGGKLYLANYGLVEALQVDPIEKKP
ncbi:MAG: hypothetical protein ACREBW_04725, partial [Candidatus Micrarchaeaceae archaeon]